MKDKIITLSLVVILLMVSVWSVSAQNQDDLLFRRRVVSSAVNNALYGAALVVIVEPENGAAAAAVPIIGAGIGALVPVLTNEKRPITVNQLTLANHGQLIGWAHGFGLSALIMGDNLADGDNYKIAVGLGAATSIGMGILGKSFGKNKPWSEGQAAMLALWGSVGPVTTGLVAGSFVEDPRLFGLSILAGGAGGYLVGNAVNKSDSYTRGDVRAIAALTTMTGVLGGFIASDIIEDDVEDNLGEWAFLCPAAGVISGALVGQAWLKNAELTPRQGMTTIWSAAGGALLGIGVAVLINSESFTPYYAIPYATSLGAYAVAVEMMKKQNAGTVSLTDSGKNHWSFSFMPQNYFVNEKIIDSGFKVNGHDARLQPMFSASVTF
ncbi:hypothetical protein EG827_04405 [bacterium]|nr:hypothetical protein [bacterium]